jgi:predicted nucleic acid-binding protein
MRKQRIYIDTSVIGGCFDEEFAKWSNLLFEEFIRGEKIAIVSEVVLEELSKARNEIRKKINEIPGNFIEILYRNNDIDFLANQYINRGVISEKCSDDALHIAIATFYNIDLLVSWNFKHIVHYDRIKKYNSINIFNGYKPIEIRSPKEVVTYEEDI